MRSGFERRPFFRDRSNSRNKDNHFLHYDNWAEEFCLVCVWAKLLRVWVNFLQIWANLANSFGQICTYPIQFEQFCTCPNLTRNAGYTGYNAILRKVYTAFDQFYY